MSPHGQVISKQRVQDHGEVFTAEKEVQAMLDLVHHETLRIDSRFLEPACGTGNFLAPVLQRKLDAVRKTYGRSQAEFERYAVVAVGSVYGVDILEDNVQLCRKRLYDIADQTYSAIYKDNGKSTFRKVIEFVLARNILWGDALTLKRVDSKDLIIFSEWSLVKGGMIKRRDFVFAELAEFDPSRPTLFATREVSDDGKAVFSPQPIKEYPLTHFLSLHEITD